MKTPENGKSFAKTFHPSRVYLKISDIASPVAPFDFSNYPKA